MEVIYQSDAFTFSKDSFLQDGFQAVALSPAALVSNYKRPAAEKDKITAAQAVSSSWKLSKDISGFPAYTSGIPIMDAVYNLSLEEMLNAIEPDGTFRTGKEWAGVWTRDVSYSIILSMAVLQPEVAQKSLLKKVKNNRIIQDTGTGGSWPVSSDRMIWAVAAWEVYKVTGDRLWLSRAYQVIKNSIEDDLHTIYNEETGLVRGESSFLDWREQTYPLWMQPADIFSSENLGTNAVHYQANTVLSQMAGLLNEAAVAAKHATLAEQIKNGINTHLWMPEKGYYGQYLYGRSFPVLSPRSDALGEALAVLFGIAGPEREQSVIANTPVTAFGIPCIYPQIPDIPPYHNDGIWPFVQAYWSLAAARTGNAAALLQSLAAIYRSAALFLTNQENFVCSTGDFAGTAVNSSNMLWSLSGNISMIHHVIFGITIGDSALVFKPFVPEALKGERTLTNYIYRECVLDIQLKGFGHIIRSFTMDGQVLSQAQIPADLKGHHQIVIVLADHSALEGKSNLQKNYFSIATPQVKAEANLMNWAAVADAATYTVLCNGKPVTTTTGTCFAAPGIGEYQVVANDAAGIASFASEPVLIGGLVEEQRLMIYTGQAEGRYAEISRTKNLKITFPAVIVEDGLYALFFRYANGNGPVSTGNKCAARTFKIDGEFAGTFVFPHRGKDNWSDWGFSNIHRLELTKGTHELSLSFEKWNENMNGQVNQALLDYLSIIRIG